MINVSAAIRSWKRVPAIFVLAVITWLLASEAINAADHFPAPTATLMWSDYLGNFKIDGVDAEAGDEVAFFDQAGTIRGHYVVDTPGQFGVVHVYGNPSLPAGSQLSVKIWDASAGLELTGPDLSLTSGSPLPGSSFLASSMPPVWEDKKGFILNIDTSTRFAPPTGSPRVSSYIGTLAFDGVPADIGDEVAVFDADNVLCALGRITTPGQYGVLHVYGDDLGTVKEESDEGAVEGEALIFRIWDKSAGIQYEGANLVFASGTATGSFVASEIPPIWSEDTGYVLGIQVSGTITDADGDGVADGTDQCPDTPSGTPVGFDGCPDQSQIDFDGDGVPNDTDQCPDTSSGIPVLTDGCPDFSQIDTDGDGVTDDLDECADTPAGTPVLPDGCPDLAQIDSDGDGVIDSADQCPDTPPDTAVLPDGCADSDLDGMPDSWEFTHGLDPQTDDAGLDPDGDDLTNLEEHQYGTDPGAWDSDRDGVNDGREILDGTEPDNGDLYKLASTLVGHWRFDEGAGTTATDASGRENHGTIDGGVYAADPTGMPDRALFMDGTDDVVTVPDADSLDVVEQLTISAWIRPVDTETDGYRVIVAKTGEGDMSYGLIQYAHGLKFYVSSNGSYYDGQLITDAYLQADLWYHVAGLFDGHRLMLYVDGRPRDTLPYDYPIHVGSAPVVMGYGITEGEGENRYFHGGLDDVRIYTRALTPDELNDAAGFTRVTGTVRDGEGSPVSDIRVDALNERTDWYQDAYTDEEGSYDIIGLLPDCYTVSVEVPSGSEYVIPPAQFLYVFPSGEATSRADFVLDTGGLSVSGTVTSDGTPVSNVEVQYQYALDVWPYFVETDEDGMYTLTNLPAGRGGIKVRSYHAEDTFAFTGIDVDLSTDLTGIDFDLVPGACISGRVVDEKGDGAPGVEVHYDSDRHNVGIGSHTDSDGLFEICNLPPGIGWIQVDPGLYSGWVRPYERAIFLETGVSRDIGDADLSRGTLVEGAAVLLSGEPITGPHVYSRGRHFESGARVCHGAYEIVLPLGDHAISLADVGGETDPSPISAFPVTRTVTSDDIAADAVLQAPKMSVYREDDPTAVFLSVSVTGTFPPLGEVRAVVFPQGSLLEASTALHLARITELNSLRVTETGTIPPLGPLPLDTAYDVLLVLGTESADGIESFTFLDSMDSVDAETDSPIELSIPDVVSPTATGRVFGENGSPALDARVLVADADQRLIAVAFTDETGGYIIHRLPASEEGITYSAMSYHPTLTGNPQTSFSAVEDTDVLIGSLHLDTTAPNQPFVFSDSPPDDTTPAWTWSSGGGGNGTFRYQLDSESGTWTETTDLSYMSETAFSDGDTPTLYVQERDEAGNWSASGAYPVSIDTPPDPPSLAGDTITNDTTPTWAWTSGGGGNGTFRYQLDGETGTWTETTETTFTPEIAFGDGETHTLYVQERDDAGNWSLSGSLAVTIDTSAPGAPHVTGEPITNDTTPAWTWTSGGGGNGTFRYQLDAETGTWTETVETTFTPAAEFADAETHTLYVQERDDAGNWSPSGILAVAVDATPPNAPTVSGVSLTNDTTPTWSWAAGGGGNGTFRYQLDSETGSWTESGDTSYTPSAKFGDDETHTLYVQERDAAGNWSVSGSFTITVDTSVPNPPIVIGTTPTQDTTPTWGWSTGGGGNGAFRYQLDGEDGTWTESTETAFTPETPFSDGESHALYVQERNSVGNWSISGTHEITVDLSGPGSPIVTGESFTADTTPAWSWSSGGGGNGAYRYQLNSETGTWTEIQDTTFASEIEFGDGEVHTLYVQERDDAGNWSVSGSFSTEIDTTGPFIDTSIPNADETGVEPDVVIEIHLVDTGSGVDSDSISLSFDGGALSSAQYAVDDTDPNRVVLTHDPGFPLSADQTYTVTVDSTDVLGNPGDASGNAFSYTVRDNTTLTVDPGESIQGALDSATPGDTIGINSGTYTETLVLTDVHQGLTLSGSGPNACFLVGLQTDAPVILVGPGATGVAISGLSVSGGSAGIVLESADSFVEGNIVHDVAGDGIVLGTGGGNRCRNNLVYGSTGAGIYSIGPPVDSEPLTRRPSGIPTDAHNRILQHNTLVANSDGIIVDAGSPQILYNIIAANSVSGISVTEESAVLDYNDLWNNGPDAGTDGIGDDNYIGVDPGANDVSVDPLFVDAAASNYQLQAASPCVDAVPSAVAETDPASPTVDLVGSLRPLPSGQDYDMGAYEYDPDAQDLAITSAAVTDALEDSDYTYQITATGAGIRYAFDADSGHPAGMTVDETTGVVAYTPLTDEEAGSYSVIVTVTDRFSRTESQTFTLTVEAVNDTPSVVTAPPLSGSRDALAMPGHAYTFVVEALDEESPGSAALEYTLGGTSPEGMSITGFVDDVDGFTKARVSWGPSDADVDTTATVTVVVSDGDATDSLSWDVGVLHPLTIEPDARVLLRTVETVDDVEETTELTQAFAVTGGLPFSGNDEPLYYVYQLVDVGTGSVLEDSRIIEGDGGFEYDLDTSGRGEIIYQLKVTDSRGFSRTSGSIEIRNVILVRIADETIEDPSAGAEVEVESEDTEYSGAMITIPAAEDAEAEPFTLTFKVVEEDTEPVPEDQKDNLGQVIELDIEVEPGMQEPTFDGLIEVTLPFAALGIDPARIEDVRVYTFDEDLNQWVPIENYVIDADNQTITFFVSHFSLFTVGLPEIFGQAIAGGENAADFRMISFPGKSDDPDLLGILEASLGVYDNRMWRCAVYNSETREYDEADTAGFSDEHPLEPGRAYWLISRGSTEIETKGLMLNQAVPFDLELRPGWNMVANPFGTSITHGIDVQIQVSADRITFFDISDTAANNLTHTVFYKFDPPSGSAAPSAAWYAQQDFGADEMAPYEGYWLFNRQPVNVILRFKPVSLLSSVGEAVDPTPLYGKLKRLARRSLNRLAEAVSTTGYAVEQSRETPPLPPQAIGYGAVGGDGDAEGGGGGACFVAAVSHRSAPAPWGWAMLLSLALAIGPIAAYSVRRYSAAR